MFNSNLARSQKQQKISNSEKLTIVAEAISTAFQSYTDLFKFHYKMTDLLKNSGGIQKFSILNISFFEVFFFSPFVIARILESQHPWLWASIPYDIWDKGFKNGPSKIFG